MLFLILFSAILFFFFAWRNIRWAVFLVAVLLPTYLIRFSVGPFPSTLLEVFLLITILVWGFKHHGFWGIDGRIKRWRLPILLFLAAGAISVSVAPDPIAALGLFRAYFLEPILFFLVCVSVLRNRRDVERVVTAFAVSALAISVYAIAQRFFGVYIPAPWASEYRVTSFYPFPNAVGLFLGPLIPLFAAQCIVLSFRPKRSGVEESLIDPSTRIRSLGMTKFFPLVFWFFVTLISIAAIILSQTVGAWAGVVFGLVFLGLRYRPLCIPTILAVVLGVILIWSIPVLHSLVVQKVTLQTWSGKVRQTQWNETLVMLRDHTFFGAGLAGYPTVFKPYHKATYIEIFQYPHNILLNFWSEMGLLGVLGFLWILVTFFRFYSSSGAQRSREADLPRLGLVAAVIVLLIHGLVDVPYFKNDLAVQFWILMATMTVVASLPKEKSVIG